MGNQVYALGSLPAFCRCGQNKTGLSQKGETERSTPLLEDDPETYQAQQEQKRQS